MAYRDTQNPGIGGLDELTDAETLFVQNLAALSYANGDILYYNGGSFQRLAKGSNGQVLTLSAGLPAWAAGGGTGTVTSVSVVSANGFAGTVATATSTPAITISTSITGLLKGNGTAISAATSGTDYSAGTSALATGIVKSTTTTGTLSIAVAGTDYEVPLTFSTGLTRTTNTITVNTSQNISTLSNLTSNGLVTTSGGTGALSVTVPGTGVLTALATNIGSAGAFVTFNGALGTPSSGTVTNLTGTASININGTVGATTPTTGSFTTVTTSGNIELGNASDTTISRVAAGLISVEGEVMNGYTTTATAAGTTTMSITSTKTQFFTGTSTQTVKLPTTSVIVGQTYYITNNSTGLVTVQSSGANTIQILGAGMSGQFTAIVATPTTAANWSVILEPFTGLNKATTASANAATIDLAYVTNTITNNSAATLTITLPTAGAIDGEMRIVRVLDFSAAAQTIAWTNTENSGVSAPTTSNGSTTLPITAGFQYNSATSKWRCIASA